MGECGLVRSALVTTSPDTPVRVSGKDSIGEHGGDEMGSFL